MSEKTKPIKRSAQLAPLSREHHDGLLFSWKIRQGLKNGTSESVLKDFTQWYWQNHFEPHFAQEEKLLLPHIPGHPYAAQLKKEHDEIREIIASLAATPDRSLFAALADTLDKHIRFEERQLFGYVEGLLSKEELDKIAGELSHDKVCEVGWKEEFWGGNK